MFALVLKQPFFMAGQLSLDLKRWIFSKHFFLFLSMLGYLLLESSFHAVLTMTVIDPSSDIDAIHRVEIYGRMISGFGSGLLFTGFFFKKLPIKWRTNQLKILIFSTIFCTVYFGQKAFIERVLVEPSTPEVRRDALLVNTVKTGIYNADVISKALPINIGLREDIEPKVMVALTSAGFLYNDQFKQTTLRSIKPILTAIASNSYDDVFEQEIAPKYEKSRKEINDAFKEYASAHRIRDLRLGERAVNEDYSNIYDKAAREYVRQDIARQAREAGQSLRSNRAKREFDRRVTKSMNELKNYRSTGGRSALTVGSAKRFIQQASKKNSDVNKSIESKLKLPKGSFQLYPQKRATPWVQHHIIEKFEKDLSNQLAREGIHNMRANIRSFKVFESHKDIKKKAKDLFGEYSVPGFSFNMSYSQLHRAMKRSFINVEVDRLYKQIKGDVSKFKDGGELAEAGKDALRALIIPCIALILSVLLSITSIVKLSLLALNSLLDSLVKGIRVQGSSVASNRAREFVLVMHKLLKFLIVVSVIYLVTHAPSFIGWMDEVKPLLAETSLIRKNIEPNLNIIGNVYTRIMWLVIFIVLPVYMCFFSLNMHRSRYDLKVYDFCNRIGIYFQTKYVGIYGLLKIFLVVSLGVILHNLTGYDNETKSYANHSEAIYEWLLSVQPAVFHYGMILNDQLSLPHMVDAITPPLKVIDENFWPSH